MSFVLDSVDSKISQTLRTRLAGQNLSQTARELGISKSLLADWVAGRRLPSLRNIKSVAKLANYLGLTLEELLLGKPPERKIVSAMAFEDESRKYKVYVERIT